MSDPKQLYTFLATPGIEMMNIMFANDDVRFSWSYAAEQHVPSLRHTSEVIGAYVTAGARIRLYQYLDRLQENAICCGMDSVIFIPPRDEPELIDMGTNWATCSPNLNIQITYPNLRVESQSIMSPGAIPPGPKCGLQWAPGI